MFRGFLGFFLSFNPYLYEKNLWKDYKAQTWKNTWQDVRILYDGCFLLCASCSPLEPKQTTKEGISICDQLAVLQRPNQTAMEGIQDGCDL